MTTNIYAEIHDRWTNKKKKLFILILTRTHDEQLKYITVITGISQARKEECNKLRSENIHK